MRNRRAVQSKDRLDYLFERIGDVSDLELQNHWARYLCVRVSGFIETSVRSILIDYAINSSAPDVANFVRHRLESGRGGFQNPNMGNIIDLLKSFNSEWARLVESVATDEMKQAINSIVADRNSIAHGGDQGITYSTIQRYYQNAVAVIELIEDQCNP